MGCLEGKPNPFERITRLRPDHRTKEGQRNEEPEPRVFARQNFPPINRSEVVPLHDYSFKLVLLSLA